MALPMTTRVLRVKKAAEAALEWLMLL